MSNTGSLIARMAAQYNIDPTTFAKTVKATCMPRVKIGDGSYREATDEEFAALLIVADKYQLNPLIKEIYAFPTKSGGIQPMIPIDGWITLVNRQETFDGAEFVYNTDDKGMLQSIECIMYRKDRSRAVKVTEYMAECKRSTDGPWGTHPKRMLRHKAFIQCARVCFGFAGLMDEDEAESMGMKVVIDETTPAALGSKTLALPQRAAVDVSVSQPTVKDAVKAGATKLASAAAKVTTQPAPAVATAQTTPAPANTTTTPAAAKPTTTAAPAAAKPASAKAATKPAAPPPAPEPEPVDDPSPEEPQEAPAESGESPPFEENAEPAPSEEVSAGGADGADGSETFAIGSVFRVKNGKYCGKLVDENSTSYYIAPGPEGEKMLTALTGAFKGKKRVAVWYDTIAGDSVLSQIRVLD